MERKVGRVTRDVILVLVMVVLMGAVLVWVDPANVVVLQAAGISVFLAGTTHVTRRIMFNRIDLQETALQAIRDKNVPAAIITASLMLFLIAVLFVSLMVLK